MKRKNGKLRESTLFSNKELVIYGILIILTAVSFCFVYDLWHTSQCSFAYLKGHFLDFYEYNDSLGMGSIVYYPPIYVLFAIWNIPLYFFFGVDSVNIQVPGILIYEKAFGILFLFLVYLMIFKITRYLSGSSKKGWGSVFIQLTIPFFFLISFAWSLYDSVPISLVLLGTYLLMQDKRNSTFIALVCFCVAVSCKTFVLFLVIPVLFFRFKKLWQLAVSIFSSLSLIIICILIYRQSPIFNETVLHPMDHFVDNLFVYGINGTSLYLICFIWICIQAYRSNPEKNNQIYYIWFPFASGALFIAMTNYNPSWVFMFIPFMSILVALIPLKERKLFYLLNLASTIGFIGNVVNREHHYSEPTFAAGVWGKLLLAPSLYDPSAFVWMINANDYLTEKIFKAEYVRFFITIIAAILFYSVYALHPGRWWTKSSKSLIELEPYMDAAERKYAGTCFAAGISLYIVPVVLWVITHMK